MEVLVLLIFSYAAVAILAQEDFSYILDFIKEKKYALKKRYRPLYHISSPVGWLSSPSGFTYFKHRYHVFYQYHPYNGAWDSMRWGQAISENLVDWVHYPPALIPKDHYDLHGCLAGSAIIHNHYLTLFYTGHVVLNNKTTHTQNIAISSDGVIFQKYLYNPVVKQPPPGSADFKNPKIWRFRGNWYMLVGTSSHKGHGQLALYTSHDMFHWKYNSTVAQSYGEMGYLWENPDLFELDGQHVLILSVQGIEGDTYRFKNMYQTGYVVGNFNYHDLCFENLEVSLATFTELDFGHDYYAAQTMTSMDGRRLLIGWLGIWESDLMESKEGWASLLTIVRELKLSSQGRLMMIPVREMEELRSEVLENAWYSPGEAFHAGARAFELIVNASCSYYDAAIIFEWSGERQYSIMYSSDKGRVSVDRGGVDGVRRAYWIPEGQLKWRIFLDASSIEVFCGNGEVVFSSRIYPKKGIRVRIGGEMQLHITQYKLRRSVDYDEKLRQYLKHSFDRNEKPYDY